ncbi:MAG: hypothetical protein ACI8RZ_007958 [Myxococcota bacterium]|jgi:hypothetical protein
MMPLAWTAFALLGCMAACLGVGGSAANSETLGVQAAQIAAFPLGFVLAGLLGGLIVHFAVKRGTTLLRVLAPMGCGCIGGLITLVGVFFFFTAIFPSL